jgi:hypothetical protein
MWYHWLSGADTNKTHVNSSPSKILKKFALVKNNFRTKENKDYKAKLMKIMVNFDQVRVHNYTLVKVFKIFLKNTIYLNNNT